MRRSIRIGLRLGLVFGIGFAVFKLLQSRRPSEVPLPAAPPDPWPPVPAPTPKPAAARASAPKPVKKSAKTTKATTKAVKKTAKTTKATKATKRAPRWVEPQGRVCPLSYPIKAKVASMIFHMPGMLNYTRTRPDRCYATEAAAKRDGFNPAKR